MPGNVKSSTYRARPATFSRPSFRCTPWPTRCGPAWPMGVSATLFWGLIGDAIGFLLPRAERRQSFRAQQLIHGNMLLAGFKSQFIENERVIEAGGRSVRRRPRAN